MRRDKRDDLLRYSHTIWQRGWVANHEGNLSVRLGVDQYLCTPTSFSKADVTARDLIVVDSAGQLVRGFRSPFSEFALHRAAFEARPDVQAVIHAHPPSSTALSVVGQGLDRPMIAESVVSLGPTVPLVPFALPKTPEFTSSLQPYLARFDVLILENHGVLALGSDIEQAFLRLEYCEHLAEILRRAKQLGSPRFLQWNEIQGLLDSRKAAGLGPEARGMSREAAYAEFFGG